MGHAGWFVTIALTTIVTFSLGTLGIVGYLDRREQRRREQHIPRAVARSRGRS